jgi:hypothetical protein
MEEGEACDRRASEFFCGLVVRASRDVHVVGRLRVLSLPPPDAWQTASPDSQSLAECSWKQGL